MKRAVNLDDGQLTTGICIDTSLRCLRVLDRKTILPEYLALYLRSQLAQTQIARASSGSVIEVLSNPNLKEIIVYLPSLPKQRELVNASSLLIQKRYNQLFTFFPNLDKMQDQNLSSQEKQALNVEQPSLLPDAELSKLSRKWQDIVKEDFPFPLAHAFTVFLESNKDPGKQFKALTDLSESIVYYLYGILASDQVHRLKIADSNLLIHTGFSVERRIEFINLILKLSRENPDNINLFVPELNQSEIGICSDIHNNLRNKDAHIASRPDAWYKQAVDKYQSKLEKLLKSLIPLKEYKLVRIVSIHYKEERPQHDVVLMMGNNSRFSRKEENLDNEIRADKDHVILLDQDNHFLDLHPFYLISSWENTGYHPHLCVFKQAIGSSPNLSIKVESTHGVGETTIKSDLGLSELLKRNSS